MNEVIFPFSPDFSAIFTHKSGPTPINLSQEVKYHWVNITGAYSNNITKENKIYVASWGSLYEINVSDLYDDFFNTNCVMLYRITSDE